MRCSTSGLYRHTGACSYGKSTNVLNSEYSLNRAIGKLYTRDAGEWGGLINHLNLTLPMAAVITVAVVYGAFQLRTTPSTECDKHRESDEELRVLDAKSSPASKTLR